VAVDMIVSNMLKSLTSHQVYVSRRQWLNHAKTSERAGSLATCQALVKHTIGQGVEDVDRKATWLSDAGETLKEGAIETARAIYTHTVRSFPGRKGVWLRLARLEQEHGSAAQLDQVLSRAVSYCPNEALLWLMGAKQKWLAGDVPAAREILVNAFKANPNNESIWLAAVKLEVQNDELVRARALLKRARVQCCTARIFLKSALLERECGQPKAEAALLDQGLARFPREPKLWLMRAQVECRRGLRDQANAFYLRGLQNCPHSEALWVEAARWAERSNPNGEVGVTKARALLDKARLRLPKRPRLWLESVRVEERAKSPLAGSLLSKALQECPQSGLLWAHSIDTEIPQRRKARAFDALKKVNDDPHVIIAVARVFLVARRVRKARSWLQRACTIDPNLGDTWAWYFAFEQKHGSADAAQSVVDRCVKVCVCVCVCV
jgi:pre-mRNA-processing factor 6